MKHYIRITEYVQYPIDIGLSLCLSNNLTVQEQALIIIPSDG